MLLIVISLSIDSNHDFKDPIPIALVYATGEKTESVPMLVSLTGTGVIKEEFKVNDGKVISNVRGCWKTENDS